MPYDNKLPRVLISENCISHLKMRVFWLSGPNGWPDKKLKHKGNVAHSTFRGGCVIDLVWKNYSLYVKIAIFSYKLDTLYMTYRLYKTLPLIVILDFFCKITAKFYLSWIYKQLLIGSNFNWIHCNWIQFKLDPI